MQSQNEQQNPQLFIFGLVVLKSVNKDMEDTWQNKIEKSLIGLTASRPCDVKWWRLSEEANSHLSLQIVSLQVTLSELTECATKS